MRIRPYSLTQPRRRGHPLAWLAAVVLVAVCASGSSGSAGAPVEMRLAGHGSSSAPGSTRLDHPATAASFTISGSVGDLYPGKTRSLVLSVTNTETSSITVTSITTTVGNPTSACLAKYVKVTSFTGQLAVAAHKTAKVKVKATLLHSAPDACQAAVFPFTYSGQGTMP